MEDQRNIQRRAQFLAVDIKPASGSPPTYASQWTRAYNCLVERIELNEGPTPSQAQVSFLDKRWDDRTVFNRGDKVRITEPSGVICFEGFITQTNSAFGPGSETGGSFERLGFTALSYTWLLNFCPIFGQVGRSKEDYTSYGTDSEAAIDDAWTFFKGRRCIFNEGSHPNADPADLVIHFTEEDESAFNFRCFGRRGAWASLAAGDTDIEPAKYWTAADMINYILYFHNEQRTYFPIDLTLLPTNPTDILEDDDMKKVINNVCCEGLSIASALHLILRSIGWSFRELWASDGPFLNLYKIGSNAKHDLYAPPVGENIRVAIGSGAKLVCAMNLSEDIEAVVNNPWGLGAPHRFEFTAELVPGWKDSDLVPDTSNDMDNLFMTEEDIKSFDGDPNTMPFFHYYHAHGSAFKPHVGRRWVLNETGHYSKSTTYDRGTPFDWGTVIPDAYGKDSESHIAWGPFARRLLPMLSYDADTINTLGIKVEFSFDGGNTWHTHDGEICILESQCGIDIRQPNLADMYLKDDTVAGSDGEIVDGPLDGEIVDGPLDGVSLNYWTSLCNDKINERVFEVGDVVQWLTRCRVTASVQLDQRLAAVANVTAQSGSPFRHKHIFDYSDKYFLQKRTTSSKYTGSTFAADEKDDTARLTFALAQCQKINEEASVAGSFTLDRLWLNNGQGNPTFKVGDSVNSIQGRNYPISGADIIQIVILPPQQKMTLITRDLRFSEAR